MTNQASEDVVDSILSTLGIVDRKSGNRPGQIQVVKQIIRTEKLKLLAEVRERVVGGDEPGITNIMIAAEHAEQRAVLTQLEAEL